MPRRRCRSNPALPIVFIAGNSTARNGTDPGWGDHFAAFVDTTRINVANHVRVGRSSRTEYNEGMWEKDLAEMKAGDCVLIQRAGCDPECGAWGGETAQDQVAAGGIYAGETKSLI